MRGKPKNPNYLVPRIERHHIESKHVEQTYEIHVMVPPMLQDRSERFPVLYVADSYGGMRFGDITRDMHFGAIPRFITVGIGYKGVEHPFGGYMSWARNRDMSVRHYPWMGTISSPFSGTPLERQGKNSGGAPEFLSFIRRELVPFIDDNYPTLPGERGFFGSSLAGGFGLYVLFNQSDMFNRYIIGSPTISFDGDNALIEHAQRFVENGNSLPLKVFLGVGEFEEWERHYRTSPMDLKFVSNVKKLETVLSQANIVGLDLTTEYFQGQSHMTVPAMVYVVGVETLYGWQPCDLPWPLSSGVNCVD